MTALTRRLSVALVALLSFAVPLGAAWGEVTASFRYPLSNFAGPVRSQWARLAVDQARDEVYALNRYNNRIRVFDDHGMEIYAFGEGFASTADIALGDDGTIFILTARYQTSAVHVCNYRGEKTSEVSPRDVPDAFSSLSADRLAYHQGSLYLVDSNRLLVIAVGLDGSFQQGHDLKAIVKRASAAEDDRERKKLENIAISGFDVDKRGNILFTVSSLFSAFRLSTDGELRVFGKAGSGLGKFGVAGGIAADDRGYVYVSDRLRCAVLVFDPDLAFQSEFGHRGDRPSNLIVPDDLAIDSKGNVYVAQAANRGVSVFSVAHE